MSNFPLSLHCTLFEVFIYGGPVFSVTQKADNCLACAQDNGPRTDSCLYSLQLYDILLTMLNFSYGAERLTLNSARRRSPLEIKSK